MTPDSDRPPPSPRRPGRHAGPRPPTASSDLRAHTRQAIELDVGLGGAQHVYAGLVENLSHGGAFVATHLLRPVGEVVELNVYVNEDDVLFRGLGEVRWIRKYNEKSHLPPGMGLKFLELDAAAQSAVDQILSPAANR